MEPSVTRDPGSIEGLLGAVALGDRRAFAELYDQTAGRMFGVIRRILPNGEQAEDALQDAFVKIWQKASTYQPELGSAISWMMTIARHQAIDVRRRNGGRNPVPIDEVEETLADPAHDPAAAAEQMHSMRRLKDCLSGLPDDRQQMVLLAYHQGWSREELALRFQRPVTTIKTMLRRSLIALKDCLDAA